MKTPAFLRYAFILTATLGCLSQARATERVSASSELPSGQLLREAPDFSQWTVFVTYKQDDKAGGAGATGSALKEMSVTKTRNIVRERFIDIKDETSEVWHVDLTQYRKPPGQSTWFETSPSDNQHGLSSLSYSPLPSNGFRGWDWMDQSTFAGVVDLGGGPVIVFVPGGKATLDVKDANIREKIAALPRVALVNQETRFPVEIRSGLMVQKFQFGPAPTAVQELPVDLREQIKAGKEGRERISQPVPRPY